MKTPNSFLAVVYVVCFAPAMQVQATSLVDSSLTLLGAWTTGPCNAVAADSKFVYIAKASTLEILDLSGGAAPVPIGSLLGEAEIVQMTVSGRFAYLVRKYPRANDWYSVSIVDINSPHSPTEIATYELGMDFNWRSRICVSGDLLFVPFGGWYGWLGIVDVSDPTRPREIGRTATFELGGARVHLSGKQVYVTAGIPFPKGGMHVFDVSNPTDPQEITFFGTAGTPVDFTIEGNRLYVVSLGLSLEVFDITTPSLPRKIGACNLVGYPTAPPIVVSSEYVYAAHDDTLSVIDVVDPASPHEIAKVPINGFPLNANFPLEVCKTSKCLYMAGQRSGLHVFDLTQPTLPVQCTTYRTGSGAHDCAVSGNLAFVAHQQDGMSIVDIATPSDLRTLGFFPEDVEYPVIDVDGDRAYLVGTSPVWPSFTVYLVILDIADPSNVREVGRLDLEGPASDIQVERNYAYVLLQDGGLKVINIENPSEPVAVGFCRVLTEGYSIFGIGIPL